MEKNTSRTSYKFVNMGNRPLKFPVKCNTATVIPAGATNVKIAFGQSSLKYVDATGRTKNCNVYLYKGRLYHGC